MNINLTLFNKVNIFLSKYGCNRNEIEGFLLHNNTFTDKQKKAIDIIGNILSAHGKENLLHHLVELARVEQGIHELEPRIRDHVVHALLSYLLGIFLNEYFMSRAMAIDTFQWKLAGLLHDVSYPVEISKKIMNPFECNINRIRNELGFDNTRVIFKIIPQGLEKLTNNINGFHLIQNRLDEWDIDVDAKGQFNKLFRSGNVCHGMLSSLTILNILDLMYQKNNPLREYRTIISQDDNLSWNQSYFENDIVSACSAIFIHNLKANCFKGKKINRAKAPLAFLLRLSDCLQDWDRPSAELREGIDATHFDINLDKDTLVFNIDVTADRKKKIEDELYSTLDAPDIRIV